MPTRMINQYKLHFPDVRELYNILHSINTHPANVIYLLFYPLAVVSCYRDPQLQVGKNHAYLFNLRLNICKS